MRTLQAKSTARPGPTSQGPRAMARRGPATAAQLQTVQRLQQRPQVQRQLRLAETLNQRGAVRHLTQRQQALSPAGGAVIQRFPWGRTALAGAGALGGAYLGSYLDTVLPYSLGTLGGGAVGGLGGFFLPSLTRWALSKDLDTEINQANRSYKTWNSPQNLADQLASSSPEFRQLRRMAQTAVRNVYGKALTYEAGDTGKTGGHTAAFSDGTVWIDESFHPSVTVQNLIFETANAAQSTFFAQVRADWQDGSILESSLGHYAELLGRKPGELGKTLVSEYQDGDKNQRRSLLQEWAEWNSLELARAAFGQLAGRFRDETAQMFWESGFKQRLDLKAFGEYYQEFGERHRAGVEKAIVGSTESKKDL